MERVELYAYLMPPGIPIIIEADPFIVDNTIPGEDDIFEAAMQLWMHRARGPLGMKA